MSRTVDIGALSALLECLYSAEGAPWPSSEFLSQCCKHVGAVSAAILVLDLNSGASRYVDFQHMSPELIEDYRSLYSDNDPVRAGLLKRVPRRFYLRNELVSAEDIATHPFFTTWYRSLGYEDFCCARIPFEPDISCHIGFIRNIGQEPFGSAEREFLDLLLPHIEQCLKLNNRIDQLSVLSELAQEHLRQIGAGLIILNEDGRINFMNRLANDMLHNSDAMSQTQGILAFNDPVAQARFAALLAQCIAVSTKPGVTAGGVVSAPRPDAASVGVMVVPYRNRSGPQNLAAKSSRATLLIFDPDMARPALPQILQDLYKLSESELLVCWHLANGESLEEVADSMQVSRETVRSQLKRIFAKTGVSRQPELVRMVLLQPAFWAHARAPRAAEPHSQRATADES